MANEPKDTLKKLTKFQQLVKSKQLDAAQHGQSAMMQELTALEFQFVRDDTPGVQEHVKQMIEVIRTTQDSGGTIADLLKVIPLIGELARIARREDASLSQKEKVRVEDAARALTAFVRKHTTLSIRTREKIAKTAGNAIQRARAGIQQNFAASESGLFRAISRIMAPRQREQGFDVEGRIKDARAESYQNVSNRNDALLNRGGGLGDDDDFSFSDTPRRSRPSSDDTAPGGSPIFASMLTELQAIRALLRRQVEDDTRDDEQAFRDKDNLETPQRVTATGEKKQKPKSVLSNLFGNLGSLSSLLGGGAGGLGGIVRTVGPMLMRLGPAAMVVGAALAGWEIGKMIDKWTGASDKVASAAGWIYRKVTGALSNDEQVQAANIERERNLRTTAVARGMSKDTAATASADELAAYNDQWAKTKAEGKEPDAQNGGKPFVAPPPRLFNGNPMTIVEPPATPAAAPTPAPAIPSTPNASPLSKLPGSKVAKPKAPQAPARRPATTPTPAPKSVESPKRGRFEVSRKGIEFIAQREEFRSKAYKDQAGVWTIGYGTTRINGEPVREGMSITKERALELKRQHLNGDLRAIERLVKVPLNQEQVDSLASLVYNIGRDGFAKSTILKTLNSGGQVTEDMFTRWNKVTDPETGKLVESNGLTARREAEYAMFSSPSAQRAAGPVAAATSAHARTTVNAPVVTVVNGGGGGNAGMPPVPMPIRTENTEATLRGIRSANSL